MLHYIYVAISYFCFYICPASDILKTNLTKFVVIWSEKASIGMFLWIRSKLTLTKEKEMRKKSNGHTSSPFTVQGGVLTPAMAHLRYINILT